MKERGMIFNSEMIRAILSNRKTQTRRIMKVQPESDQFGLLRITDSTRRGDIGKYHWAESNATGNHMRSKLFSCPFGAVGDRIWVRETWSDVNLEGIPAVAYRADGDVYSLMDDESFLDERGAFNYDDPRVTKYHFAAWYSDLIEGIEGDWRPSIHMPRWASRILLEITGVRVERLNAISEEDATAEGVPPAGSLLPDYPGTFLTPKGDFATAKVAFQRLWESIYGEESWKANGWVWVISFKRVEGGAA
ncbi:morphogenetic protein [Klebsiella quasipneumoniae subsp. similipneumoniae]|uniref:morphogenetic protein n=1 Tax=Klebsiella quasipneumoniae TaxID=1463165 RepID=UPI003D6E9D6A